MDAALMLTAVSTRLGDRCGLVAFDRRLFENAGDVIRVIAEGRRNEPALAAAYAEAESHRRIAVARQRPRAALKYTALIIGGFVGLLAVFSRRYLEPYDSAVGQVVLAAVGFYWAAGLWWMHRMGRSNPVPRFLTNASGGAA